MAVCMTRDQLKWQRLKALVTLDPCVRALVAKKLGVSEDELEAIIATEDPDTQILILVLLNLA